MKKDIITLAICLLAITNSIFAADVITIDDFKITAGETKSVNITLSNDAEYVGFQFDLYLPDSISIESYSADRSRIPENTALSMSKQQDGSYRFITMAIDVEPITGNSGTIITLNVKAARGMSIGDDTGYFRKVKLSKSNATGPTYSEFSFPIRSICYLVKYKIDGLLYHVDSVGYGKPITPLTTPVKEGYTFSGWSEIPATMPANDVEVSGYFSINSYILTYKLDGFPYHADTLLFGAEINPLPSPTKDGYTFLGWSNIPSTMPAKNYDIIGHFIEEDHDSTNVSGDDAGWGDGYDLIYKIDGKVYKTITYESGATITAEPAPTKEGYTFSGWSEIPTTMPANNVEVTGSFSINSYTITYKVDGEVYHIDTLNYATEISALSQPTKEGYTFSGWSEIPATMPANNVEVNGSFSINSYVLTYKVDGQVYHKDTLNYAATITALDALTKEGYTFSGWSQIPTTMPANNVEVNGSFSINSYILTYKVDGEVYLKDTLNYATAITALQDLTKEGYTFSGWSQIPTTMPANNVEVNGSFSINSYVLTYKVDGEVYHKDTLNYAANITALDALTKEGYTFSGWSEIPQTMPANNVEVTGSFSINSYVLTYFIDGEEYKKDTLIYASKITAQPNPDKEGYTFSGWSKTPATMPANDVEVTGSFSINSYILTYKVDGEVYLKDTLNYATAITALQDLTKEGYTFSGWSQIPTTMPANNVEVNGSFSINSYILTYKVDGEVYHKDTLNYAANITALDAPTGECIALLS